MSMVCFVFACFGWHEKKSKKSTGDCPLPCNICPYKLSFFSLQTSTSNKDNLSEVDSICDELDFWIKTIQ